MRSTFIFLALASAAFGGSIVVNGDFETGDLTGWTINPLLDTNAWAVGTNPHTGNFAASTGCVGDLCINGTSDDQNYLFQNLATLSGHTYTLSFWYDPANVDGNTELLVLWGNSTAFDLVTVGTEGGGEPTFAVNSTTPASGYNFYTISGLGGTDSGTVLNFLGRNDPSFSGLDDISVVGDTTVGGAVPEPGTYMLAAAGLLALGIKKLRA
jgi:hypothetical protein